MYFRGFDATVQAGGYNSFHETRSFGLPALFYPNMNTGMDDQLARCRIAEEEGWGIVLENRNKDSIVQTTDQLFAKLSVPSPVRLESGAWSLARALSKHLEENA